MITGLHGQPTNFQLCGVSTDSKPLDFPVNTLFLELDTGDFYYFDGSAWAKVGEAATLDAEAD